MASAGWRVTYDPRATAWTEAPETFRALAKQRYRWAFGTLQCLWKHRAVLWTRKLDTGHAADDKALKPGSVVNVGFAVHDDNVTTRFHHVSFPLTLGVGTKGTISSVALQ